MNWFFAVVLWGAATQAAQEESLAVEINRNNFPELHQKIQEALKSNHKLDSSQVAMEILKKHEEDRNRDNEIKKLKHEEEIQGFIMTQQKIANDLKEAEKRIEGFEQEVKTLKEEIKNLKDINGKMEESKKHCKIELEKAHKALDDLRRENETCFSALQDINS